MEAKDLVRLKAKLFSKAKNSYEPRLEAGQKTWFFCRHLHFVGVGEIRYVYPTDIGHGPETPLCRVKGQVMSVDGNYDDFQGNIHQEDIRHSKKEAIRGLMKCLAKKEDKRRAEMTNLIYLEAQWGRHL